MTAVVKDLLIEQGATYTFAWTWFTEVDEVTGEGVVGSEKDLTGWVARMQIRKSQGSPVLVDATSTNGKIRLGDVLGDLDAALVPTNGRIRVLLSDEDTDAISAKTSVYDLEAEDPDGHVFRLLKGTVTLDPNVTQEDGTEPVAV